MNEEGGSPDRGDDGVRDRHAVAGRHQAALDSVDGCRTRRATRVVVVGARITDVALAVPVGVGLIEVRVPWTIVDGIGNRVAVGVVRIHGGAGRGVGVQWTGITEVTQEVAVAVRLDAAVNR